MHTDILELLRRGHDLVRYLRGYNEQAWSDWLDEVLDTIRSGRPDGVQELLDSYRGIAGIQDLFLCQEAGHKLAAREEATANEQLLVMVARLHNCARNVSDYFDAEQLRAELARAKRRANRLSADSAEPPAA